MLVFHLAFLLPSFLCFGGPESSQEYQEYNHSDDSDNSDDSDDGYIDAYDSFEYDDGDDDSFEYYNSEEYSSAAWPSSPSTPTQHCPCSQDNMAAEHSIRSGFNWSDQTIVFVSSIVGHYICNNCQVTLNIKY